MRFALRFALLPLLLLLLTALPLSVTVRAHADYARSEPAADAVLDAAPQVVKVWFTQELFRREGENWLLVTGPDGARVDLDDAAVDDDDRTLVTVSLSPALADGLYTVEWRALSADDGHAEEGSFSFTVAAGPTPAQPVATDTPVPAPTAPAAETTTPASGEGGFTCLGAAPLALLAVGAIVARRRKL